MGQKSEERAVARELEALRRMPNVQILERLPQGVVYRYVDPTHYRAPWPPRRTRRSAP
jgi:hypothetical protein